MFHRDRGRGWCGAARTWHPAGRKSQIANPPSTLPAMPLFAIETHGELHPHLEQEWLLTNGLGGYAFSTVVGCNTDRKSTRLLSRSKEKFPPGPGEGGGAARRTRATPRPANRKSQPPPVHPPPCPCSRSKPTASSTRTWSRSGC